MLDASATAPRAKHRHHREVVAFAHSRLVSVEAELGRIGTADFLEQILTKNSTPTLQEAAYFVQQTAFDALAVISRYSAMECNRCDSEDRPGTAESYPAPDPALLVLHGGSGTPPR